MRSSDAPRSPAPHDLSLSACATHRGPDKPYQAGKSRQAQAAITSGCFLIQSADIMLAPQ